MHVRLCDAPPKDSVGLRAEGLDRSDLDCLKDLHLQGLVLIEAGWLDAIWFRLSPEGRRVKASGALP